MTDYHTRFLELAMTYNVLRFGEFTLKSGRVSPYFFNAGLFNSGAALAQVGRFYAAAIEHADLEFDLLFGPAYKGIPLVSVTAAAMYDQYNKDIAYAYNRKEAKAHGEGGQTVGAPVQGRVLIIDDVITAGTAIRESVDLITAAGAEPAGVVIALDRQETGQGSLSAVEEVEQSLGIPVVSIASISDLITMLRERNDSDLLHSVESYQQQYGTQYR